jgi:hypothetical protein
MLFETNERTKEKYKEKSFETKTKEQKYGTHPALGAHTFYIHNNCCCCCRLSFIFISAIRVPHRQSTDGSAQRCLTARAEREKEMRYTAGHFQSTDGRWMVCILVHMVVL